LLIKNGLIYSDKNEFKKGNIKVSNQIISEVSLDDINKSYDFDDRNEEIIDAEGLYVIPGLIDIHMHGCAGYDFCNGTKEALDKISNHLLMRGVTSFCPASMTLSKERLGEIFGIASQYDNDAGARLLGINMEGPFISEGKKGAQNPDFIQKADYQMFVRLQEIAGGKIRLVSLAPEIEGATDFIKRASKDVHVSLAHSECDYNQAMEAFRLGADHVTHLYNGMNPFNHRNPGIIGAASDAGNVFVEIIADGIHVSPAALRMAVKFIGEDRLVFISDSMEACGMPDGKYELGGLLVTKKGERAVITGTDTIAGSVSDLMNNVKNAVINMQIPLETAVRCATVNPAKSIGIYEKYGSISTGKYADMLMLDKEFNIIRVIKAGKLFENHLNVIF